MDFLELEPAYTLPLEDAPCTPGHWFGRDSSEEDNDHPGNSTGDIGGNSSGNSTGNIGVNSSGNLGTLTGGRLVVYGGGFTSNSPLTEHTRCNIPQATPVLTTPPDLPLAPPTSALPQQLSSSPQPLTKRQKANKKKKLAIQKKRLEAEITGTTSTTCEKRLLRLQEQAERRAKRLFNQGIKEAAKASSEENSLGADKTTFSSYQQLQQVIQHLPSRLESRQLLARAETIANRALKFDKINQSITPSLNSVPNDPRDYLHHIVFRK